MLATTALIGALLAASPADPPQSDAPAIEGSLKVERRYLHLPVHAGAKKARVKLSTDDGTLIDEFEIELTGEKPDFHVFLDLEKHRGETLKAHVANPPASTILDAFVQADDLPGAAEMYKEPHRPQFHFTSMRGWLNDPNGLVWQDGEYHLFYQHNPFGWGWGNMHWGHATSPNLVHWTERPTAISPRAFGDWVFSGSAVEDTNNTGGFQTGERPALVAAFTSTGRGECIVYSNDRGRTWTEFEGNPVVKHNGRDPRLLWHEPTKKWVMAVYDEDGESRRIDFYTSPDLKAWTFASRIDGFYECPDIFELPIDGDHNNTLWVLYAADAQYMLGAFDGETFRPTSGPEKLTLWHGAFYAAQTFSNEPKGRRIQIGWGRGVEFPGSPFNQQMVLPVELTLRTTPDGPRMFANPVAELRTLRAEIHDFSGAALKPDANLLRGFKGKLFEIEAVIKPESAEAVELNLRGVPVVYDVRKHELSCKDVRIPLPLENGEIQLHLFLDEGSIEIFANGGRAAASIPSIPEDEDRAIGITSRGGEAVARTLAVYPLRSIWPGD